VAIPITLYKFSKKINSTKLPEVSTPKVEYADALLKDACDLYAPTIQLNIGAAMFSFIPNYAYIPLFERYYFIDSATWQDGIWTLKASVDVLASFKTEIGAQSLYIVRSTTSHNGNIVDNTYPATSEIIYNDIKDPTLVWNTSSYTGGTFIVGVGGQSTTYYLFTKANLDILFADLFDDIYIDNVLGGPWATIFQSVKTQFNPLQFITSIMWVPFLVGSPSFQIIRIGYGDILANTQEIPTSAVHKVLGSFSLTNHPQISRGKYLNAAPYTSRSLYYPPFGMLDLDATLLANDVVVITTVEVDLRTGLATLKIKNSIGDILTSFNAQVGINYQVSQVLNSGYGIGEVVQGLQGIISGGMAGAAAGVPGIVAGAAVGSIGGIENGLRSKIPSARTIGGTGSINSLIGTPTLYSQFAKIVDEDYTRRGRPLCAVRTINTLTGYIQTDKADISTTSTKAEQEQIRSYMEGGFYFE
jgi:hypothetical protein